MTSQAFPTIDAYKIKEVAVLVLVQCPQIITDDIVSFKVPAAMKVAR